MKKENFSDEIDIAEIILNLWKNKIKIIGITTVFLILGFLYFNSLSKNFIATTNIKPISTFENDKYKLYNSLAGEGVVNINQKNLLDLFIEKIKTEEIIEDGIVKFELINKDDFQTEGDYQETIQQTATLVTDQITPPSVDEKNENKKKPYWKLNFKISDKESWKNFLKYLEIKVNEEIRQSLINRFNKEIDILNVSSKFKLEDIEQKIVNELNDYKISITNRLAFLKEQAEIARTLNIKKNTLEAENFQTDNTVVTNIKSENSYYLKGYEMIEKEMSLISSRENEKLFIPNLTELEKSKRAILQNKKIERLKFLFSKTPVANKDNFVAAKIDFLTTEFKSSQPQLTKILSISLMIGLIVSLIYLFLSNIIHSRK
jgi:LPS O-antigen subunit length determinant protein (WzzB/FepE family)